MATPENGSSQELWMPVPEYEGLYEISSIGRVKSLKRISRKGHVLKEKFLKASITNYGYVRANLWKDGVSKPFLVHILVAISFIENPENKPWVNHKKGIKTDNRATELEWSTPSENVLHGFRVLGRTAWCKGKIGHLRSDSREINQFTINGDFVATHKSIKNASISTGTQSANIDKCLNNLRNTAGGFFWTLNNKSLSHAV